MSGAKLTDDALREDDDVDAIARTEADASTETSAREIGKLVDDAGHAASACADPFGDDMMAGAFRSRQHQIGSAHHGREGIFEVVPDDRHERFVQPQLALELFESAGPEGSFDGGGHALHCDAEQRVGRGDGSGHVEHGHQVSLQVVDGSGVAHEPVRGPIVVRAADDRDRRVLGERRPDGIGPALLLAPLHALVKALAIHSDERIRSVRGDEDTVRIGEDEGASTPSKLFGPQLQEVESVRQDRPCAPAPFREGRLDDQAAVVRTRAQTPHADPAR
jgi:hypothetical protein